MIKIALIIITWYTQTSVQNVINLAQGKIRGMPRDGYIFYGGIPYTSITGPTGRFRRGGIAPTWKEVRASSEAHCLPSSPIEECLKLDVSAPGGEALPVLVWVAGGTGMYNPTKLAKEGLIVVTVRHRLGPIGFLCSSEDKIPGNAGLKDVVMALRWVRDNIVAFNGNPNKVVVAGQSFGAAMAESLLVTHMAKGLFHGVILQSGTVLAPWAFNYDAEDRAKFLRMQFNESRPVTTFAKAGIANLAAIAEELNLPYMPFGICMENPLKNEEMLMSASPLDLITKGKVTRVPIMMGYTTNEAYIFSSVLKDANVVRKMSKEMTFLLPVELQTSKRAMPQIVKKVNEMYFEDNMTMPSVFSYHKDAYFLSHIHRSLRCHASSGSPVYYYQFSYLGNVGVDEELDVPKFGAAHSDELAYLFSEKGRDLDGDDGIVQGHLITLWSNFVKHLNPSGASKQITWEPVNFHDIKVLNINIELNFIEFPYKKEAQMWEDVYDKYYYEKIRS
ncbi:unnamed protein product, partial [Brenthis ino]